MKNKPLILNLFLFLFVISALHADTIYVTPTGASVMNGQSWSTAFPGTGLQLAITNASNGDQIWVACGTYTASSTGNRGMAYSMKNNVEIYGGFQGIEEHIGERSLACGPCSILSGEIGNAGNGDNSYKIISNSNLDNTAVLDGFTIQGANDNQTISNSGAGLGGAFTIMHTMVMYVVQPSGIV